MVLNAETDEGLRLLLDNKTALSASIGSQGGAQHSTKEPLLEAARIYIRCPTRNRQRGSHVAEDRYIVGRWQLPLTS